MAQYAEITHVGGPESATEGNWVMIPVQIVNKWHHALSLRCTGHHTPQELFIDRIRDVASGETWYLSGLFRMPNHDVVVLIASWFLGTDGQYHLDDQKTRTIKLTELVPSFSEFKITDYRAV